MNRVARLLAWCVGLVGLVTVAVCQPPAAPAAGAENWPCFRGPENGMAVERRDVVTEWNEAGGKNILWKTELPLAGVSSPIVWGEKVFVTAADDKERRVICIDAASGKELWNKAESAKGGKDVEQPYADYSYACQTPATDGKYVVAQFANGDIACFDFDGKEIWASNLGDPSENAYGYSCSPTLYKDKVIIAFDGGQGVELIGLDIATGKRLWRNQREGATWASPIVGKMADGSMQVILPTAPMLTGWNADNGEFLWEADVLSGNVAPSALCFNGLAVATMESCGVFAVKPGGKDKLDDKHFAWKLESLKDGAFPDTISPTASKDYIYIFQSGMLACVDGNGKIVYEKDVEVGSTYSSPLVINDKLFIFGEDKTLVVAEGKEYKLLGTCSIGETFQSTPAFANGRIFIRGEKSLYAIGKK